MAVTIYHNPRCSKSRQTLALITERGIDPHIVEYLKHPPSEQEIAQILTMLGKSPRDIMRRGEALYKEMALDNPDLSDQQLIAAMVENPILIERPIVLKDDRAALGRPPDAVLDIL